ncbi:G2/mitotic-specific cyclin-B3 [Pseudomyrmex gracilis]|uniref:G2/mitotic-specific cyclin-B3 n=1 Tax=Pseudomyrmex gracilis TaxID=219809 RepID=UPI0009954CAD|nr:G2/mitotic-specific cyclin-B3 [Pseudomyrmex gracilis]XP_020300233.1 G2/mitotic-specific cyclin-B3 [Pseudomyrmex gracilis]XP_020300234.1 G2/mitotic-specific cyclin-B3 [Pseudomyrmex gracilis]
MAPPKVLGQNRQTSTAALRTGVTTRRQNAVLNNLLKQPNVRDTRSKRKAEASPLKEKTAKRSAFANITNAITTLGGQSHVLKKTITQAKQHDNKKSGSNIAVNKPGSIVKPILTKSKPSRVKPIIIKDQKKVEISSKVVKCIEVRQSIESEKSDGSLYISALEDITDSIRFSGISSTVTKEHDKNETEKEENIENKENVCETKPEENDKNNVSFVEEKKVSATTLMMVPQRKLPEGVQWDFDVENWLDPFQVSHYAMDIFEYLKSRESLFTISNYMERQVSLSQWMRALLVDWMVEVQESFELNHETLYLAVKLVDLYLTKVTVSKETLQLLGAASLFIACKFDERIPPMVEDFLYICDGAYSQRELIRMEISVLKVVNFDLGIPLSYRFLRRYARCAKVSMSTLTLARFILEHSLMDYSMITFSDSKMAAAALLLAMLMKDLGGWTPTLEYYSGYKLEDIRDICHLLNHSLHKKQKDSLMTVRNKYSHPVFHEVAKLPLKETLDI